MSIYYFSHHVLKYYSNADFGLIVLLTLHLSLSKALHLAGIGETTEGKERRDKVSNRSYSIAGLERREVAPSIT